MKANHNKGTQGAYGEPVSSFGGSSDYKKIQWDGVEGQRSFGNEFEFLINNGYEYRLVDISVNNGKYEVVMEVLERGKSYWAKKWK